MNEPQSDLARDLKALQYTDALDAGDVETIAALWDEASRDPQLEQILTELDAALFVEEAGRDRQPGVRLKPWPARRRWALALCGAAAAGVVAVLAWSALDERKPESIRPSSKKLQLAVGQPPENNPEIAAWWQYRQALDGEDIPAFTWPLQGDVAALSSRFDHPERAQPRERDRSL